jgi:hypothetical protein
MEVMQRVKGDFRRRLIWAVIQAEGLEGVPLDWRSHDISEGLKSVLGQEDPAWCGGEDLPNLLIGEVEIARVSLINSVHGEVSSLRARRSPDAATILLRLVDEYETEFELPTRDIERALTAEEVVSLLQAAHPSPLDSPCELRLDSWYYDELDAIAEELGAKKVLFND